MHRLKDKFAGQRALIIFGGPSIIENRFDLSLLDKHRYIVFLESKALTPYFLGFNIEPDFFLMFYPEKCKANSFQGVVFQSFLADIDLTGLIREQFCPELRYMRDHFDEYFETWKPEMLHKRYRWKPDVYLKNSPFDLLPNLSSTVLVTYVKPFRQYVTRFQFKNPLYEYDMEPAGEPFSLDAYYNAVSENGALTLRDFMFSNSAAIALFPLLNYLGFKKVYFIGMDMSMLGSMEYSALYTFRSLRHFRVFFEKARPVFSFSFPRRRRLWAQLWRKDEEAPLMRPRYEFESLRQILSYERMEFVNVYEPFEFARPLDGIRNISFAEFLRE